MAPVNYSLAGSWPSKMSLGQGDDFAKYHAAQHGGAAPYPVAVSGAPMLSGAMEGPAMMHGLNKAMADIAGLSDMPGPAPVVAMQKGAGRRKHRRHTKSKSKKHSRKHTRKHTRRQRRQRRQQGGALGFAPVGGADDADGASVCESAYESASCSCSCSSCDDGACDDPRPSA